MQLKFLGTGPAESVEGRKKNRRLNSSLFVNWKKDFLIDVTPHFSRQLIENKIKNIDFILLTHAHFDAVGGIPQLIKWLSERDIQSIDVYCEARTWQIISSSYNNVSMLKPILIRPYKEFVVGNMEFTPVRVIHTEPTQEGVPTLAYKFNNVLYSEDVSEIPKESENILKTWIY